MESKCPCCGTEMQCVDMTYKCTGCFCAFSCNYEDLPRIAAAIELAMAAVWADECEAQRDYMDDTTSNRDAWRSVVNLDLDANDKAHDALERVIEVFGGE